MKPSFECPVCATTLYGNTQRCRRCGSVIQKSVGKNPVSTAPTPQTAYTFNVATLLLFTTLAAVCLALFAAAPGLGICMAIVALPPLIRTSLLVRRKKRMGISIDPISKVGLFVGSMGVTIVITVVTTVVALLTFCLSCFGTFMFAGKFGSGPAREGPLIFFAAGLTLTVVAALVYAFSKWIKGRWERDLKQ